MVFSISLTIFSLKSSCLNIFLTSWVASLIPPPKAPITTSIRFRSFRSNASCLYFVRFSSLFVTVLFSFRHAISQIHKIFFSLSTNIKSGLLDSVIFLKLYSNSSRTSFAWSFSRTYPLHHFFCTTLCHSLQNWIFLLMKLPISSMLCCAWSHTHYLPTLCIQSKDVVPFTFAGLTVCIYYIWQALLKLSMILFQPFVPAEAVFLGVVFCLSHELQISFCFPNISLCICPIPKFCPIQKQ